MSNPEHVEQHIELYTSLFGPVIEAHPERLMQGMHVDGEPWHYDASVVDTWSRFFRGWFGRFPRKIAERIAYKNAEEVIASRSSWS